MSQFELVTDNLNFPEGPIATENGDVIVVEIKSGTLARISPAGEVTRIADCGGGPNGAAIGPDGMIYVCNNGGFQWHEIGEMSAPGQQPDDYIGGRIQRVNPNTGKVVTLYDRVGDHPLLGPNDIVFDQHGGFWFTDLGKTRDRDMDRGGLYYAKADGSQIQEVVYPLMTPNGVGLSPDGDRVYVSETHTGRVWSWDVPQPGQATGTGIGPSGATLLWGFDKFQLLDSLGVDGDGNVCVATLITSAISVISPAGELLEQVVVPGADPFVTNICFGGPDLRTAYVTSSGYGRLYKVQWPRPGLQLAHNL
ncbi:gluconolactonase [Antricoccus suffuscus]|uniref:Gluconolactonase n=1 Tax=Antricoccus suffuscus TaxID=1629062 RepID=A0A2T0ZWY2_9ACTN|nr:SMP-30/gluconolactonase/LRE family protein [Antricoccus suffuscus]PRZ40875.1 gluconolactonase [Antricoccus suffuscus]